jgi:branched-chain amino acid transport system permease protein
MCSTLTHDFPSLLAAGLANGFLYALIALGYTMVYGVLQLINFAHSEVFMSGGFAGYFVLNAVTRGQPQGIASVGLVILGIAAGACGGGAVAFALERVAYRPLRRRRAPKLAFLISAIGASYFLYNLAGKEFGRQADEIPNIFTNGTVMTVFGAPIQTVYVIWAVAAIIMLALLDRLVALTKLGRGIRAVAQDAETASLMGVNIDRVISQTFVLGGLMAGAAGFLFALPTGVVYTMGFTPALKAFTAAVLGGIGNLRGAMLGGLALGVIESCVGVGCFGAQWEDVVAFSILILVLMFRPTGLLGERLGRSA